MQVQKITQLKDKELLPLPIQIKNQLNSINQNNYSYKISNARRLQTAKYKINRINNSSLHDQKQIINNKIDDYFTPVKNVDAVKKRPLSCNIKSSETNQNPKSAYQLARPLSSVIKSKVFNSERPLYMNSEHAILSDKKHVTDRKYVMSSNRYKKLLQKISDN